MNPTRRIIHIDMDCFYAAVEMREHPELYRAASRDIRAIFHRYTDLVEPLSLDEAYLDVSHHKRRGSEIADEIRVPFARKPD